MTPCSEEMEKQSSPHNHKTSYPTARLNNQLRKSLIFEMKLSPVNSGTFV